MSCKNFIHPKNKYREPPNFKELALLYPEFAKVAIMGVDGIVKINFKDEESLKVLTETLLKHDYGLEVKILEGKLVPAVSLRVNYVLWLQDLLEHTKLDSEQKVSGLDIGTGSICIYPLLIAKMCGWRMTGTEIDPESIQSAKQCVEQNGLSSVIQVKEVNEKSIFQDILSGDEKYTFSMCNPPFHQLDELSKVVKKQPPNNAPTGSNHELIVEGGERAFTTKMIQESEEFKDKVMIFTTMCGRKSTLKFLKGVLAEKNITNTTWTEFCQGFTKRWGLAWTFQPVDVIDLTSGPSIHVDKEAKKQFYERTYDIKVPVTEKFPTIEGLVSILCEIFTKELEVDWKQKDIDDQSSYMYTLTTSQNSWSHARRKRRMEAGMNQSVEKKIRLEENPGAVQENMEKNQENPETSQVEQENAEKSQESPETSQVKQDNSGIEKTPYLVCNFLCQEIEMDGNLNISMLFESGSGGKAAVETLRQWLINRLDVRENFLKQHYHGKFNKKNQWKKYGRGGRNKFY